jgi:hypothetical protein
MNRRSLTMIAGVGAVAAAAGAYLFSKPALRKELRKAENPREALDIVGKHLQHDGQELATEVKDFAQHPRMHQRIRSLGKYFHHRQEEAKDAVKETVARASRKAHDAMAKKELKEASAD